MEDKSRRQNAEFSKVKNGYAASEVDAEMDRLCGRIEMLQSENERLDGRLHALSKQLSELKAKEQAIDFALAQAGELRSSILKSAQQRASELMRAAEQRAKEQLEHVDTLRAEENNIRNRIKYLLEAQLAILEADKNV